MPAYKLIFIAGPDPEQAFPVGALKSMADKHPTEICMIGNGKDFITSKEISQTLSGHTDVSTRISIYGHGSLRDEKHTIKLITTDDVTADILSIINNAISSTVIVDLYSCYAGSTADAVMRLPAGSMLICHAPMRDWAWKIPADANLERYLDPNVKPLDLLLLAFTSEVFRSITVGISTPTQPIVYSIEAPLAAALSEESARRYLQGKYKEIIRMLHHGDYPLPSQYLDMSTLNPDLLPITAADLMRGRVMLIRRYLRSEAPFPPTMFHSTFSMPEKKSRETIIENWFESFCAHNIRGHSSTELVNAINECGLVLILSNVGPDRLELLINLPGINVSQAGPNGDTAIFLASLKGDINTVRMLIDAGANVNAVTTDRRTPLLAAVAANHPSVVAALLKAHSIDINLAFMPFKETPLCGASLDGRADIVRLLINAGANVNLARTDGYTPLFGAVSLNHLDVVKELLKARSIDINLSFMAFDETPLCRASHDGRADIVRLLIKEGADVNLARLDSWTPLYEAVSFNHPDVVEELLKAPSIDINFTAKDGGAPHFIELVMTVEQR